MNCWREKRGSVAEATSLRFRQVRILSFKTLKTLKPKVPYRSDAFQNDHKSNGYHLKYQQQFLLCKIPPILQLMNFCQTSSVFSDPLDLLDHPLLLDSIKPVNDTINDKYAPGVNHTQHFLLGLNYTQA